ncbi:hypothetical protein KKA17_11525 [bacterium]|nr:hypothetical protein [bacterium]MBU1884877.1 hypothetical protein [bacterium]
MKEHIPSLMMGAFLFFLLLSLWKVYQFLPNKQLQDDDNTEESIELLTFILLDVLKSSDEVPTFNELFTAMTNHTDFDKKHFWRFNQNKLNNLLTKYYIKHGLSSIKEIYNHIKSDQVSF